MTNPIEDGEWSMDVTSKVHAIIDAIADYAAAVIVDWGEEDRMKKYLRVVDLVHELGEMAAEQHALGSVAEFAKKAIEVAKAKARL